MLELPPCPPLSCSVALPAVADTSSLLRTLPERAGVLAFEDADGATIALLVTANLRRLARTRLGPRDPADGPSRRIDYGPLTRVVRAAVVGSAFEADWACLQLARRLMPASYRALLDPWRAWFVHCATGATHPRFVRRSTAEPGADGVDDAWIGPFADKHAAQRFLELHQDLFDLCRYHHILVEAPHGAPCVYKEMGRCPAPCDGTIPMVRYAAMVREAVTHASGRGPDLRSALERSMQDASTRLDFEEAARLRRRLEALDELAKPAFRFARDRRELRFIAVQDSGRDAHARLFLVLGGWIAPIVDVPRDAPPPVLDAVLATLRRLADDRTPDLSPAGLENLGLVGAHLFPRRRRTAGSFLPLGPVYGDGNGDGTAHAGPVRATPDRAALARAIRRACGGGAPADVAEREL